MNAMTENTPADASVSAADVMQAVRESAMLADVSISVWSAERSDPKLMERIKSDAGATGNVGRTIKNLLAGADGKLKDVRGAFAAVRSLHYGLTLPWVSDPHAERQRGARLLPTVLFDRYIGALSKQKTVAKNLLEDFILDYPSACVRAQANLGSLVTPADYPPETEVRAAFKVDFDIVPLPSRAGFAGLPEHTIERLARNMQARQRVAVEGAQRAMWEAVRERVSHLAARLADADAIFKTSTVEQVRELVTLLPGWNLVGDEKATAIMLDIKYMLAGVTADTLRDDTTARLHVAASAQSVVSKMDQWGL